MNIHDQVLNVLDALAINDKNTAVDILFEIIEELEKQKVETTAIQYGKEKRI